MPPSCMAADERRRSAVAVRHAGDQALASGCPAVLPNHVGLDRGLVQEEQPAWGQAGLLLLPVRTRSRDVRTVLFGGMQRLFLCVSPSLASVPCINPSLVEMP